MKRLERVGAPRELSPEERPRQQEMTVRAIRVTLANPQEVKNRRGHKTDKKDAWWLAHLWHGMIRPSYVPERPVRELRMLTRQRREKIRDVAREKNRLQKILEQGHVKLRGVMSDLFGASGQAILQAMILDQQTDPVKLAGMAKGSLQKKKEEIIAALQGHRLPPTQRLLLKQGMEHLALLAPQIEGLYHQIEEKIRLEGWKVPYRNLQSIPGLKETEASEFLAEVGPQATAFPQCGASERGVGSVPEMTRERQATQRTHDEG